MVRRCRVVRELAGCGRPRTWHRRRRRCGVLAVASTGCYAASAVLQEREAGRQDAGGAALLRGLVRRPWWWLAVAATVAGAVLHVAALASGPLSLVQPFGVLTLVLALPPGRVLDKYENLKPVQGIKHVLLQDAAQW